MNHEKSNSRPDGPDPKEKAGWKTESLAEAESGAQTGAKKEPSGFRRWLGLGFTTLLVVTMLIPLVGMSFWMTTETSEKREMNAWPSLMEEDGFNWQLLPQMGAWYEDHFAFRPWLITAYAELENSLFHESSIRNVLRGKGDWLFYQDTLDTYLGLNPLSDRQIFNIVHNLGLMNYSLQTSGARFVVTIAPNKNTIYPEAMKSRYLETETKDIDRLTAALRQAGIPCVDLKTPLLQDERTLYFEKDSHWNSEGALLAYNTLMDAMGIEHETFEGVDPDIRADHESDLDTMLNPKRAVPENEYHYEKALNYTVDNTITDFMDDWIETSGSGDQTLLMFRDSFGEALAPFMATQFQKAWFSRLTPYNLIQVESLRPDWVILERVERRMAALQEQPAIMNMPTVASMQAVDALQSPSSIKVEADNGWYKISGRVAFLTDREDIYLEGTLPDGTVYTWPVFYIEDGYGVYLRQTLLPAGSTLRILLKNGSEVSCIDQTSVQ